MVQLHQEAPGQEKISSEQEKASKFIKRNKKNCRTKSTVPYHDMPEPLQQANLSHHADEAAQNIHAPTLSMNMKEHSQKIYKL